MRVNNRFSPKRRDWSAFEFSGLQDGCGVLFEEMTLDERIGPEAVALLIGSEPDEVAAKTSLDFGLKAGIAPTPHGPVLFLIWWVPPIVNGRPTLFYEQIMNPMYAKTSEVLRRVAEQNAFPLDCHRWARAGSERLRVSEYVWLRSDPLRGRPGPQRVARPKRLSDSQADITSGSTK
jgi:hypothetical protein